MKMQIDYPSDREIQEQKEKILQSVFLEKSVTRPDFRIIFYHCRLIILIELLIYGILLGFCISIRNTANEGYTVLALYPMTYFSFYFLAEEQSEMIELKQSMKYSFTYLISMRMLYTNILSVFLNLAMIGILQTGLSHAWSLAAAGTTADILLALASIRLYEKTGSAKSSGVLFAGWILLCFGLLRNGSGFYHVLIEIVPFAVHLVTAIISFIAMLGYMRKVERKNAYNF